MPSRFDALMPWRLGALTPLQLEIWYFDTLMFWISFYYPFSKSPWGVKSFFVAMQGGWLLYPIIYLSNFSIFHMLEFSHWINKIQNGKVMSSSVKNMGHRSQLIQLYGMKVGQVPVREFNCTCPSWFGSFYLSQRCLGHWGIILNSNISTNILQNLNGCRVPLMGF